MGHPGGVVAVVNLTPQQHHYVVEIATAVQTWSPQLCLLCPCLWFSIFSIAFSSSPLLCILVAFLQSLASLHA